MSEARVMTVELSAGASPTWQTSYEVVAPPEASTLIIGLQCSNMPTGGFVAMSVPGPDAQNSINIPKTPITSPNMVLASQVTWPANYTTEATLSYWQGATAPQAGASISPVIWMPAGPDQMVVVGKTTYQFK